MHIASQSKDNEDSMLLQESEQQRWPESALLCKTETKEFHSKDAIGQPGYFDTVKKIRRKLSYLKNFIPSESTLAFWNFFGGWLRRIHSY